MMHVVTLLKDGKPVREPHIYTRLQDCRPFEGYQDQPDTAERVRLEVQKIPFALPDRKAVKS